MSCTVISVHAPVVSAVHRAVRGWPIRTVVADSGDVGVTAALTTVERKRAKVAVAVVSPNMVNLCFFASGTGMVEGV